MNGNLLAKQNLLKYSASAVGLVLVGCVCILFAFQINSWNKANQNTKKELLAVQAIAIELKYYKFLQESGSERMNEVIDAAEYLLDAIRNPELQPSNNEIEIYIHKLTRLFLSATPTTQYVALNSSGDFSHITSEALRNKSVHLSADQEKLLIFEGIQVRYVDQQLRPFLNRSIDRTTVDSYKKDGAMILKTYSSPFNSSPKDLLKNREFANILVDLLFHTKRLMFPYNRIAITIKEMEEIISNEYPLLRQESYKAF